MLAITVNCPVAGSHISVGNTGWVLSSNPEPLLPPTTKTLPSGRSTAFCWRRGKFIVPLNFHAGLEALRSIDSVVAVGGSDPPRTSTFPESYITPGLSSSQPLKLVTATFDHAPEPLVSR